MTAIDINKLEHYSLVKAHTIRMWERRFALFNPSRTKGNRRHYEITDLKHLLNVSLLNRYGFQISKIVSLSNSEIDEKIYELSLTSAVIDISVNDLLIKYLESDVYAFETTLNEVSSQRKIGDTIEKIIIPFLQRASLESYSDRSPVTHFVVTSIRKKLLYAIETTEPPRKQKETVLMFLPDGEHYDLILLYLHYAAKLNGYRVIYLGTNVPVSVLDSILLATVPEILLSYHVPGQRLPTYQLSSLAEKIGESHKLIIAAPAISIHTKTAFSKFMVSYQDAIAILSAPETETGSPQ